MSNEETLSKKEYELFATLVEGAISRLSEKRDKEYAKKRSKGVYADTFFDGQIEELKVTLKKLGDIVELRKRWNLA